MTEHVQPALRSPTPPRSSPPTWATDCHFHIFGPFDAYPLAPVATYRPEAASIQDYRDMAGVVHLERYVIVQPSVYGTDNRCTLDAVEALSPDRARAVVVVDQVTEAELRDMHRRGARGVRCNVVQAHGAGLDLIRSLADQIAPLGWHIQVYMDGSRLPDLVDRFLALPVPVVIDHMGQMPLGTRLDAPPYQALLRLLESGRGWVKLCSYRSSSGPPYTDVADAARAMIAAAPDRCLWGTDWPHPNLEGRPMPDDGLLLDYLADWTGDADMLRRILVDNPAQLYGFA